MSLLFVTSFVLLASFLSPALSQATCPTCNCRVSRPPILDQLINRKIDRVLNGRPIVRMLRMITDNRRNLFLQRVNTTSLIVGQAETLATISLTDATIPITASPLAYRPMFSGNHRSMLGTLFINIEEVFPCVARTDYNAICRTFSDEDDGFRGGRAILDSGDDGNTFRIFGGTGTETYGVTFQRCPVLDSSCLPDYHSFTIACYLPATCDPYM